MILFIIKNRTLERELGLSPNYGVTISLWVLLINIVIRLMLRNGIDILM